MLSEETKTLINSKLSLLQKEEVKPEHLVFVRDYFYSLEENTNVPIQPAKWISKIGKMDDVITLLLKGVTIGLFSIDWKMYHLDCAVVTKKVSSFREVLERHHCPACNADYDISTDETLIITFSPSENITGIAVKTEEVEHVNHDGLKASQLMHNTYFRKYFSSEVVAEDAGIRIQNITILFTDIKESTNLYEKVGDLNAFRLVKKHFTAVESIVAKYNGVVVKTIGDAVMASFTVTSDGLLAAIDIQNHFISAAEDLKVAIKMGLHSGPALVVNLNDKLDYFGTTINIAARVQNLSKGGDVFISKTIFDDARCVGKLKSMPAIFKYKAKLKGIKDEYFVYQIREK